MIVRARTLGLVLLGAFLVLGASPAEAKASPDHVYTYDVQSRGAVQTDLATFAEHAQRTFADRRGWSLGGAVSFRQVRSGGDFTLWLSEAGRVPSFSRACSAAYSCRVGRNVVINDSRWRGATPSWTGTLEDYQHYVVNHETGHWLGLGHTSCPGPGRPAAVMQQQSKSLQGCTARTWPLDAERASVAAARGLAVRPDPFSDLGDSPFAEQVLVLAEAGIVAGYADGTFRPDVPVSRGEVSSVLARGFALQPTGTASFSDLEGSVHARSVLALADARVVRGYDDGTFRPLADVTRGQLASMLARQLTLPVNEQPCELGDATPAACAAVRAGLAHGFPDGTFRPGQAVTRGQLAALAARALGLSPRLT